MPEGKIIKALSGFYYVANEDGIVQCRGRGVFRKNKVTPLVGDEVVYQAENDTEGYILEVKDRKNELVRPPIANVDQAILVFSAVEPGFSTTLLDRFLVLVEYNHIEPLICITKMDLTNEEEKSRLEEYAEDYRKAGYEVIFTSSETSEGLEKLRPHIEGKISVFAGQSGVGKSSLLNAIRPDLELKTDDISSHLGRGKHTTRHVELITINNGLVADTPGFSSLEFTEIETEELNSCFPDIAEFSENCKFRGCLHMAEPKCGVKAAVESGILPEYRYEHYKDFLLEIKDRKPRY
ncbi:ribosome small subunit-dependent GTPase A [Mesobacillus sp. AQ2]|jgi:ribosome biogenesis GTPase / thiamine phosphate phosphatase|uniref:ribosome small subunit-dependent GTPase A n=1 Tax=unclassified Mesobacillus TaxID=2675270 RepID=UPI00203DD985|nr:MULTISPECIES: ribosome small subunit-dependent GTPase A [unclassified Mesobacillus]MCM3123356.1 ribosome small subunit-dependent GTPase A [Mesobacillus sp. MER 33]MCM3233161.1 ribosome small subunit-dependent GTPase A [Mesobacillus sp. MER 48]WHX42230.1 ribosome small subunit-dependent GTPase A [Mesobacillus sp. AQ2]